MTPPNSALWFFSNAYPTDEGSSSVVFRRHLLPLVQSGTTLAMVTSYPAPRGADVFWRQVPLPTRDWYWPPYWPSIRAFVSLRSRLAARRLRPLAYKPGGNPPLLLAHLWDAQALVAAAAAKAWRVPLGVFIHDDEITWCRDHLSASYLTWRRRQVLDAAHRIWPVSARILRSLRPEHQARATLLRPIPGKREGYPAREFASPPEIHLGYAGKLYPGFWPLLLRLSRVLAGIGGTLTVITDPENAARAAPENVTLCPYFATPELGLRHLHDRCTALLVAHPERSDIRDPRWHILASSFPSKLCEYAQLELPLVLITEPDSEFGDWCSGQDRIPWFTSPEDPRLQEYLGSLRAPTGWQTAAAATRAIRDTQFSPEQMQAAFFDEIRALRSAAQAN